MMHRFFRMMLRLVRLLARAGFGITTILLVVSLMFLNLPRLKLSLLRLMLLKFRLLVPKGRA